METIATYSLGIISLLIFVLIVLVQSALVGVGKGKAGVTPGADPEPNYDNALYRMDRAHLNGVEIMPAAAVALIISILVGVSSWWVNLLMGIFLLTRIAYIAIYAKNVGAQVQGARTMIYVAGWAMLVILCLMSILALL